MQSTKHVDTVVCGSGCAGSLLAWILARRGMRVVLIDRGQHPRFAIGESSTPLADFLLEKLADDFDLPELRPLARWGSWTKTYPELRAGKKRGFSYYGHAPGTAHVDDEEHRQSLVVAASADDEVSDTHWMRADVDQWLCQRAVDAGVSLYENTEVHAPLRDGAQWIISATQGPRHLTWRADWLIDATGGGGVVPRAAGIRRIDDQLLTQTGSLFGHFTQVGSMPDWLQSHGVPCGDDPFHSDDAAQHHVLADGWVWMLRFDCGITSVGFTRPTNVWKEEALDRQSLISTWQSQLHRYPTLGDLLGSAQLVGPCEGNSQTPTLGWMPRISRLWEAAAGDGWLALPSTVGVIDPLHSTGIAHALSGVLRAGHLIVGMNKASQASALAEYRQDVVEEVRWIDRLVAACYAGLPHFELFAAACSFYFIAAHTCEEELRDTGQLKHGFLGFKRPEWQELVMSTTDKLKRQPLASFAARQEFIEQLRGRIEPWNKIGLLDPTNRNRYSRSATKSSTHRHFSVP